ncbi:hypothetical protein JCM3766R1_005314 [Sporobolomyces carnicolor]
MPVPVDAFSGVRTTATVAVDDWESAYDKDEEPVNVRIWREANEPTQATTSTPTYTIMRSSPSTCAGGVAMGTSSRTVLPPRAALDPTAANGPPKLMILKRPPPSSSATLGSTVSSNAAAAARDRSLKERERDYLEARRRIYGEPLPSAPPPVSTTVARGKTTTPPPIANARRDSRFPSSSSSGATNPAPGRSSPNPSRASTPESSSRSSTPTGTLGGRGNRGGAGGVTTTVRKPKGPAREGRGFGATTQ